MAAALAATIPAPQSSDTQRPSAPKDVIPKNMAHAVDIEAEIELKSVCVDGLVCFFLPTSKSPLTYLLRVRIGVDEDSETRTRECNGKRDGNYSRIGSGGDVGGV